MDRSFLRMVTDYSTIVWDDDETAMISGPFARVPMHRPRRAIYAKLQEIGDFLIRNVYEIQQHRPLKIPYNEYDPLLRSVPQLSRQDARLVETDLIEICKEFIMTQLGPHVNTPLEADLPDGLFLGLLGTKRDYKNTCAICLDDPVKGTTCPCGHTEIVVFRPCGHALCQCCFEQFMESHGITLPHSRVTQWCVNGEKDVNVSGFLCPTCQQVVLKTLRAEAINLPNEWNAELKIIANQYTEQHLTIENQTISHH